MGTTGLRAVIALLGLFILSSMLKKHHVAAVRTFLDSHKTINKERLDEDSTECPEDKQHILDW